MNRTLFTSWYALIAFTLIGGFIAWLFALGIRPGRGEGSDINYLLVSGWTTLGLMVIVTLYSLRKYVHKMGLSPETRNPLPLANLERAEAKMNELRQQILKGIVSEKSDVTQIAKRILSEEKISRVVNCEINEGPSAGPKFLIRVYPTEPLGRVAKWLHSHIYLGLASGILVWLHGGGNSESWIGSAMNWLTATVIVTGIVGTFLFALGPSWLTAREKDMTFEESFILASALQEKLGSALKGVDPKWAGLFRAAENAGPKFGQVSKALHDEIEKSEPAVKPGLQDLLTLLHQKGRIAANLRGLSRIRFWMNIWRAVHIPASIVLLLVVFAHVILVWKY